MGGQLKGVVKGSMRRDKRWDTEVKVKVGQ